MDSETNKEWLTVSEAARRAQVSRGAIYRAAAKRDLQHVRVSGGRSIRTTAAWVDDWLRQFISSASTEANR